MTRRHGGGRQSSAVVPMLALVVFAAGLVCTFIAPMLPVHWMPPSLRASDRQRPTPASVEESLLNVQIQDAAYNLSGRRAGRIRACGKPRKPRPTGRNRSDSGGKAQALFGRTGLEPLTTSRPHGAPRVAPLLTGGSGDVLCFAARGTRQARGLRHQSFCLVQRLCHTVRGSYVLPLPRSDVDAAVAALRAQPRLAVVDNRVVSGFSLDRRMAFFSGLDTTHFAEWVDGPLFMWAYQHHAWRFGASQVRPSCRIGGGL